MKVNVKGWQYLSQDCRRYCDLIWNEDEEPSLEMYRDYAVSEMAHKHEVSLIGKSRYEEDFRGHYSQALSNYIAERRQELRHAIYMRDRQPKRVWHSIDDEASV